MKNIFITGGTGKIGKLLVDSLRDKDYNLFLLYKKEHDADFGTKIKYVIGDLSAPDSYGPSLSGIDAVVHMAALTHTNVKSRYYAVNAEGTSHLVKACESRGVKRFILVSTRAISEDGGDYSKSKLMAEEYVKESRMDWIILRLAEVYGVPGGKGVDRVLDNIDRLPIIPIIGNGAYRIAPLNVRDGIWSIMKAIEREDLKNKIYTIAGPESFTYNEFIERVLELKHVKKARVHIPISAAKILFWLSALIFKDNFLTMDQIPRLLSEKSDDISQATRDLCFNPMRLELSLK